ncbi:hypothetical protein BB560_004280 [Smittium megazygosporum]|uniref:Calcium-transporting ATPase n=1 Tax=Smittium megazygosporum TaxID=133381 RepID=A0A2T9Z9N7_9FUNG|nr:hypothetical protein BB560_004280 [Smittium megazygosporum]
MSPPPNETAPLLGHDSQQLNSSSPNDPFPLSPKLLVEMIDTKDSEALKRIGGTEGLCKALRVDPSVGLSQGESFTSPVAYTDGAHESFSERRAKYGRNTLPKPKTFSFFELLFAALNDSTLIMLIIASFVSLAVGIYEDYYGAHRDDPVKIGWVEGVAIMVAVAVVSFTNAINDYSKERQFQKLNAKKEDRKVKLLRDGIEVEAPIEEINVGDILLLEPGDILPVDGVYLQGHNVVCDESSATGESDSIKKGTLEQEKDCFILSGGKVMEGVGTVVIVAVGTNSYYGKIMMAMRAASQSSETPLQIKLDKLSEEIAKFGVCAASLLFLTLLLKLLVGAAMAPEFPPFSDLFSGIVSISIECITLIVVAVPEGLPMAVTIALAYATTQMIKDDNLVRQLAACETMGNATAVCTDKTGTLTQNRMTVVRASMGKFEMESAEEAPSFISSIPPFARDLISEGSAINSSAFESADANGKLEFIGSKSECALLECIQRCGFDYRSLRADNKPVFVWPFSSEKKTMATAITVSEKSGATKCRVHIKGASEIVLSACTHFIDSDGSISELSDSMRVLIQRNIYRYAHKALRTFALAFKDIPNEKCSEFDPDTPPLTNLVWICLVGIQDPLRSTVAASVQDCQKAGVFVRMITGDNIETAEAIAKNAGILTKGGRSITGPHWRQLTPEQQHEILPRLQVVARSSPLDKQIIVKRLQERDEVVAMTGDGTNDAPALKMADVGFSMGIAGTEVAKEASDIILMKDDFSSIVKALKWGRAVNDSVRKFLQFQLTVNIAAVLLTFISSVMSSEGKSALSAVQLLWVNIIMDTLAALALATEGPTDELLNRKPTPKSAALLTFEMWRMILFMALFQVSINLTLINIGPKLFRLGNSVEDKAVLKTIVFNTFVFLQVFNEVNCRRIMPNEFNIFADILNDKGFLYVQVFIVITQYFVVTYGGLAFSTTPLTAIQWIVCIFIGSLSIPIGYIIRLLPDFGQCFGLQSSNSSAQQYIPEISVAKMSSIQRAKDVKNVISFFAKVRNSMKERLENNSEVDPVLQNLTADSLSSETSPFLVSSKTDPATGNTVIEPLRNASTLGATNSGGSWASLSKKVRKADDA